MTIEKLEYFYTIAKYNSISQASTELHVSISSLSTALKKLEQEIGYKLFERKGKKLLLSEQGRQILPSVELIISETRKLKIPLHSTFDRPVIRVGTSDASFIFEAQRLSCLDQAYQIKYSVATSLELLNKLSQNELDFVITSAKIDDPKFSRRLLVKQIFKVAIGEALVKDKQTLLSLDELQKLPVILLSDHLEHQRITKNINRILGIAPNYLCCPDCLGLNKLIAEGAGVLYVTGLEQKILTAPPLRFVSLPIPCSIDFYLYHCASSDDLFKSKEIEENLLSLFTVN